MLGPECKGLKVLYFLIVMLIAKIDYFFVSGTMLSASMVGFNTHTKHMIVTNIVQI